MILLRNALAAAMLLPSIQGWAGLPVPTEKRPAVLVLAGSCTDLPDATGTRVEYEFKDGMLRLRHVNAYFNCAAYDFGIRAELRGDELILTELCRMDTIAGCGCYHDLTYRIANLPARPLRLVLNPDEEELYPNTIRGTLDLAGSPVGVIRADPCAGSGRQTAQGPGVE